MVTEQLSFRAQTWAQTIQFMSAYLMRGYRNGNKKNELFPLM